MRKRVRRGEGRTASPKIATFPRAYLGILPCIWIAHLFAVSTLYQSSKPGHRHTNKRAPSQRHKCSIDQQRLIVDERAVKAYINQSPNLPLHPLERLPHLLRVYLLNPRCAGVLRSETSGDGTEGDEVDVGSGRDGVGDDVLGCAGVISSIVGYSGKRWRHTLSL